MQVKFLPLEIATAFRKESLAMIDMEDCHARLRRARNDSGG
jgi:hypothetical protein